MLDSNQITLLQAGLKYTPPTLVLEYKRYDTMKVHHFSVTFKNRNIKEIETKKLRKKLIKSYPNYFHSKLMEFHSNLIGGLRNDDNREDRNFAINAGEEENDALNDPAETSWSKLLPVIPPSKIVSPSFAAPESIANQPIVSVA